MRNTLRWLALAALTAPLLAGCLGELPAQNGKLPPLDGSTLTNLSAANLTGTLPALNGAAVTNLTAANLTGGLPAIDGSKLTGMNPGAACCRLTLSPTNPVPSSDIPSIGTIYYLPFQGNLLPLYNGATWIDLNVPDSGANALSIAVPATANSLYDVFAFINDGAVALELGPAWTGTGAAATRQTPLVLFQGVYVKQGDNTRRYLGTFGTLAASTSADAQSRRLLWNYYNRRNRLLQVVPSTASWNINTTWGPGGGNGGPYTIQIVTGVAEDLLSLRVHDVVNAGATATLFLNIAKDGIIEGGPGNVTQLSIAGSTPSFPSATLTASLQETSGEGYHSYEWVDYATVAIDGYATAGPGAPQSFMDGQILD